MADATDSWKGGYIGPVNVEGSETAAEGLDPGSARLRRAEQDYIRAWRKARGDAEQQGEVTNLAGLALSGGGIRSATFSLGVMQALAHRGLLKRFDYLSTVSGGGYIGSAITWLVSAMAHKDHAACEGEKEPGDALTFGLDQENVPFGCDDPDPAESRSDSDAQGRMLRYLRQHGNYLSPGAGISLLSLVGVVLRGTLLNLLVWIPIFVLVFLAGFWASGQLSGFVPGNTPALSGIISAIKPDAPLATGTDCARLESLSVYAQVECRLPELLGFEWLLWVAAATLGLLLVIMVLSSLFTRFRRGSSTSARQKWYSLRRHTEKTVAALLPLVVLTLIIGTLPMVAAYLHNWLAAAGPVAMVTGGAVLLRGFLRSCTRGEGAPAGVLVSLAAAMFLYGVFLVSYQIAFLFFPFKPAPTVALGVLILVPLVTGWLVNLNYISIHRFYRDRLMETFMPDICDALRNRTGAAFGADGASLQELGKVDDPRGPYHIVNTNLVLVNSGINLYQDRGGDNFILSPLYCGSNATGWSPTPDFMGGKMTLATAMAISGAAANPNTGVGGEGLTRNLFLSLVMSLLNLKLGYWACNPDPDKRPGHCPNHFLPGAYSFGNAVGMRRHGFNEHRSFLQLSDGGHFENTGVYELVRRRVKLIIACDGGADAEFSFSDFQTTIRRIEDDFGARIKAVEGATPDDIVPVKQKGAVYPKEAEFGGQGHMVATIRYADGTTGTLIYLKTALIKDVSFKVKGYAAQNPEFPDQSTADQFFDAVQFEAYRELGYRIADKMLKSVVPGSDSKEDAETLEALIRAC